MSQAFVVVGAPITLTALFYPAGTETLGAAPTTPVVSVTRADGTVLATGVTATVGTPVGTYTFVVLAAYTNLLDRLTVAWSGGLTQTDTVDVVGDRYMTPVSLRAFDKTIFTLGRFGTPALQDVIDRTEIEAELIMRTAYRGRFDVTQFTPSKRGWFELPYRFLRTIRFCTSEYQGVVTTYTASQIASIQTDKKNGWVSVASGWPGTNVTIGYEHGVDHMERGLFLPMCAHARYVATAPTSGLPENIDSVQPPGGNAYRVARGGYRSCGVNTTDLIYLRFGVGAAEGIA